MWWLVDVIQWTAEPVGPGQSVQVGLRRRHRYRQIHAYSMDEALALAAERVERETKVVRHPVKCPVEGCEGTINVRETLPSGMYPCQCHHARLRLSWATDADGRRKPVLSFDEACPEPRRRGSSLAQEAG